MSLFDEGIPCGWRIVISAMISQDFRVVRENDIAGGEPENQQHLERRSQVKGLEDLCCLFGLDGIRLTGSEKYFSPTSDQFKSEINGECSCKRHQRQQLEFFTTLFGTRRSVVQIHSPRPK